MNVFKNIYNYRELLKNNVKKEIRGKYKNSVLGVIWTFLNPLLQLLVYALIFPLILKTTQPYYVIFVCVGLIPWTFFTTSVSQSAWTIIGNGNIVKKVYFPREILPISVVTSVLASYFEARRSEWSLFCYIADDIVIITLWLIPIISGQTELISVLVGPILLLINDIYGSYNWKRLKKQQREKGINE